MARLYIIGPVTGIEDRNELAFLIARDRLDSDGYDSEIPHEFIRANATHEWAMLVSINHLTRFDPMPHKEPPDYELRYDGVALLDGWEQSEGARLEKQVAEACGIPCKTVEEWLEAAR